MSKNNIKKIIDEIADEKESVVPKEDDSIESLTSMDKEEEFTDSDVGTLEDVSCDTGELEEKRPIGKIKPNLPPKNCWNDGIKTKYKVGDIVNIYDSKTVYKVICPSKNGYTYEVQATGVNTTTIVYEENMKFAPENSVWKTFWEENNPFAVKGLKISCPSNNRIK